MNPNRTLQSAALALALALTLGTLGGLNLLASDPHAAAAQAKAPASPPTQAVAALRAQRG